MKDKNFTNYSNFDLIKDVFGYVRPYWKQFLVGSFFRFTSDLVWLYPAIALSFIITFFSNFKAGESLTPFWLVIFWWALASIWRSGGQQLGKLYCYRLAERVGLDAQLKTLYHLFDLNLLWHEKENSGNKLKKLQRGGEALNRIMRMWVDNFLEIGVNFVGMVLVVFNFNHSVAYLMIVFLVSYYIISYPLTRRANFASKAVNETEEDFSGLSFEALNNIRTVKVLSLVESIKKLINGKADELFIKVKRRVGSFRTRTGVMSYWGQAWRLATVVFICVGIARGQFTVGFLVLFYMYFNKIWESVGELSEVTQNFIIYKYHVESMEEIIREPLPQESAAAVLFPADWSVIRVRNLCFSYGENEVFSNLSFEIKKGERVGVVGLSGAGKSTLFKLLLKEHEDYSGEILFDDVSSRQIKRSSFFKQVAVVLQETEVFNFTLRDNITIANADKAGDEKLLKQSLEVAHVDDFVGKLPQGLDTFIGEKGIKLSGGEKQRVGIARAVFKQPQILFLDEATSHLDLESEEKIKDSLHKFFQNVTAVVIAHRLTTIKEMDRILVMENGKIIEEGSFDELYKTKGRFFDLWEKQKL